MFYVLKVWLEYNVHTCSASYFWHITFDSMLELLPVDYNPEVIKSCQYASPTLFFFALTVKKRSSNPVHHVVKKEVVWVPKFHVSTAHYIATSSSLDRFCVPHLIIWNTNHMNKTTSYASSPNVASLILNWGSIKVSRMFVVHFLEKHIYISTDQFKQNIKILTENLQSWMTWQPVVLFWNAL